MYYFVGEYFVDKNLPNIVHLNEDKSLAIKKKGATSSIYGNVVIDGIIPMIYKWKFKAIKFLQIGIGIDSSNRKYTKHDFSNSDHNSHDFYAIYNGGAKYSHYLNWLGKPYKGRFKENDIIEIQ